jgi:predicted component of type VI protein secretion system
LPFDLGAAEQERLTVFLDIPDFSWDRANVGAAGSSEQRWSLRPGQLPDEDRGPEGGRVRSEFRELNARLRIGAPVGLQHLRLATLIKSSKVPAFAPRDVPPVLQLDCWPPLLIQLQGLLSELQLTADYLARLQLKMGHGLAVLEVGQRRQLLLLHLARLQRALARPQCHPLPVFEDMADLAAELAAFAWRALPGGEAAEVYNHQDLGGVLARLGEQIQQRLATLKVFCRRFSREDRFQTLGLEPELLTAQSVHYVLVPAPPVDERRPRARDEFRFCFATDRTYLRTQKLEGFSRQPVPPEDLPRCLRGEESGTYFRLEPQVFGDWVEKGTKLVIEAVNDAPRFRINGECQLFYLPLDGG